MTEVTTKLVFVGEMGAGKTTAIRSISDQEPVSTEMPISDEVTGDKTHTTVALDYSSIALDSGDHESALARVHGPIVGGGGSATHFATVRLTSARASPRTRSPGPRP